LFVAHAWLIEFRSTIHQAIGLSQEVYSLDSPQANPSSKNNPKPSFQTEYAEHHFRQFYLHDKKFGAYDKACPRKIPDDFQPPLGWFLSQYSQDFISCQIGRYQIGRYDDVKKKDECQDGKGSHNNCVFKSISGELNPKSQSK
jgi:hypothetical protein